MANELTHALERGGAAYVAAPRSGALLPVRPPRVDSRCGKQVTVTRAQALEDASRVIAGATAIFTKLTSRESEERIWTPAGPSVEEITARIEASRRRIGAL